MSASEIKQPFQYFADSDGTALEDGYIYIGVAGFNAETAPKLVYWDRELTIVAPQPLRTVNGRIVRSGAAAAVFTSLAYSITVRDKRKALVSSSDRKSVV